MRRTSLHTCLLSAFIYFLLKLPMVFVGVNPEEPRDLDAFLRVATGQLPYFDFNWLYGPVAPFFFGWALKILPSTLLTIRLISVGIWTLAAFFLARLLFRFRPEPWFVLGGVLLATGCMGYPSYTHSHDLAALGLIACGNYLVEFLESRQTKPLFYSFLFLALLFFCRPLIMGYCVFFAWLFLIWWHSESRFFLACAGISIAAFGAVYLTFQSVCGPGVQFAFVPTPWTVLPSTGYPNLHALIPKGTLKSIQGSLETLLFYGHFFIWPTALLTLAYLKPSRATRYAVPLLLLAVAGSVDVLHYGFIDPFSDPKMGHRGAYFFALAGCSLWVVLAPKRPRFEKAHLLFLPILAWAYFPYLNGTYQLVNYPLERHGVLSGLAIHPRLSGTFQAIRFINERCGNDDNVVLNGYVPEILGALKCRNPFEQDVFIFTRPAQYALRPFESAYVSKGNLTNGELIQARLKQFPPTYYFNADESSPCREPGWKTEVFGEGERKHSICWRKNG